MPYGNDTQYLNKRKQGAQISFATGSQAAIRVKATSLGMTIRPAAAEPL